eukprot:6675281-Prymnesium_polylepis.1
MVASSAVRAASPGAPHASRVLFGRARHRSRSAMAQTQTRAGARGHGWPGARARAPRAAPRPGRACRQTSGP